MRLAVWASAFSLYVATVYPSWGGRFQWGDAAKWQYIGNILGLPHPPGSPLYVLASWFWSHLPIPTEMAVRINLLSGLIGSLAAAQLFVLARRLGLTLFAALAATVAFAISQPMWVFSTEAEVYSLAGLFNGFILDRAIAWRQTRKESDFWWACGAWLLGFQVHLTLTLLGPALLLLLLTTEPRYLASGRWWMRFVGVTAIALLPVAWIWFRAPSAPYSEMESPRTWEHFWRYLTAQQYGHSVFEHSWRDVLYERPGWGLTQLGAWSGYGVVLLVPVGLAALARQSRILATFLGLAMLGPFLFWVTYGAGDERGDCIPLLPALMIAFGAATQDLVSAFSNAWARRGVAVMLGALLIPSLIGNTLEIFRTDRIQHFHRENDGDKQFVFDLPCLVKQADANATIIVPWGDYGTRQVAYYYQWEEPASVAKHLNYRYLEDSGYPWAPRHWRPDPAEASVVWAVKRVNAEELRRSGYSVETINLGKEQCGPATHPFRAYRAAAPAQSN